MSESPTPLEQGATSAQILLADSSPEKNLEDRFVASINAMVDEADARRSADTLVDVLAWAVARMIMRVDSPWGAGDIMRRIGNYVCSMQDRKKAQQEAEKAKEAGQLPH